MNPYLTDTERQYRPIQLQGIYRFWLDFSINLNTRSPTFRRWFQSLDARNQYVLDLSPHCAVVNHGEEPENV